MNYEEQYVFDIARSYDAPPPITEYMLAFIEAGPNDEWAVICGHILRLCPGELDQLEEIIRRRLASKSSSASNGSNHSKDDDRIRFGLQSPKDERGSELHRLLIRGQGHDDSFPLRQTNLEYLLGRIGELQQSEREQISKFDALAAALKRSFSELIDNGCEHMTETGVGLCWYCLAKHVDDYLEWKTGFSIYRH